jgi:hypothetical protein
VEPPVFSPSTFTGGSIDHFDSNRKSGDFLMHPSLSKGKRIGQLHADEALTLQRLGYDVNIGVATSVSDIEVPHVTASIYPNPAPQNSAIRVNLKGNTANEILVVVYDMMGRESYSKVIMTNVEGPYTAIDPHNNLAAGMYVVIGSNKNELFNEKLIIHGDHGSGALPALLTDR